MQFKRTGEPDDNAFDVLADDGSALGVVEGGKYARFVVEDLDHFEFSESELREIADFMAKTI